MLVCLLLLALSVPVDVCPCHQVTNPPIDPLREGLVMSLEMRLGGRGNLLQPSSNTYRQVSAQLLLSRRQGACMSSAV